MFLFQISCTAHGDILRRVQPKSGRQRETDRSKIFPAGFGITKVETVAQKGSFQIEVEQQDGGHEGKWQAVGHNKEIVSCREKLQCWCSYGGVKVYPEMLPSQKQRGEKEVKVEGEVMKRSEEDSARVAGSLIADRLVCQVGY